MRLATLVTSKHNYSAEEGDCRHPQHDVALIGYNVFFTSYISYLFLLFNFGHCKMRLYNSNSFYIYFNITLALFVNSAGFFEVFLQIQYERT